MLMLFFPNPTSGKLALFIISNAAANINPAMNGLRFFKVVLTMKLSLFLNKNLKTKYNNTNDGSTMAKDANSDPNMPPIWYPTYVAQLMEIGPGVICDNATTSANSLNVIHPCFSTTSNCIIESMA